jgi:3-dehydrosphinganine reductase
MVINGKLALVTGGSSGIGFATALKLAQQGASVWILARNPEKLAEAENKIKAACHNPAQRTGWLSADVSNFDEVTEAIKKMTAAAGAPDLLINSAGEAYPGYAADLDVSIYRKLIEINYLGTVHVTKAVLPAMLARHSGHIVNLSSGAGYIAYIGYTAYSASKFAVRGFSDALRDELKSTGVQLSVVFPPDTDTPQLAFENTIIPYETRAINDDGGLFQPEFVANAIVDGITHNRYNIIPGFMNQMAYRMSGFLANFNITDMYLDMLISGARQKKARAASKSK